MSVKLKKGDSVFLSKKGAKGFFYPTKTQETLKFDVEATTLAWVGGSDKRAVLIPRCSLGLSLSDISMIPVWICPLKGY